MMNELLKKIIEFIELSIKKSSSILYNELCY